MHLGRTLAKILRISVYLIDKIALGRWMDFRIISGPIPEGSPIEMAIRMVMA